MSARLSIFALRCVRPIVEACDGRLVFAGGEDVVALLPADTAMDCAAFLRSAYRGDASFIEELAVLAGDLVVRHAARGWMSFPSLDDPERRISPFLIAAAKRVLFKPGSATGTLEFHEELEGMTSGNWPGADTVLELPGGLSSINKEYPDISAGIAIAHHKEPLQDVVHAAHVALTDHAKKRLERGALAVSLVKRSGETVHWGCKWDSGGLELLRELQRAMTARELSRKFPHRLIELLAPYEVDPDGPVREVPAFGTCVDDILQREFAHALKRQRGPHWPAKNDASAKRSAELSGSFAAFLQGKPISNGYPPKRGLREADGQSLTAQEKLRAVSGLLKTAAFITPKTPMEPTSQ